MSGPGGRDPFDPFSGFGAFGGSRTLMSSFFGGRDPFDDPFFARPFGGMFESNVFGTGGSPFMNAHPGNPFMGAQPGNPFMGALPGNPFMGAHPGNPFMGAHPSGFIDQQPSQPSRPRRGLVIEEINSDDEKEEKEVKNGTGESSRKHGRSSQEPFVESLDDEVQGRSKLMHLPSDFNRTNALSSQSRSQNFTFHSSTVSYGGSNGTYYTASNMKRTGSDGLTFEESKEANSATGQAKHRVSRGINEKGHSVMRKLNSDGRVDTMQTLHNIEEDELPCFEETWKGAAKKHLPGLQNSNSIMGAGSRGRGLALPSTGSSSGGARPHASEGAGASLLQNQGKLRRGAANGAGPSRGRPREGGTSDKN